jgi:beta-N-acetylhexosaminidase
MTLDEKAAQVLMTGIDGKDAFPSWGYAHFRGCVPGAVLLFRHNVASSEDDMRRFILDCDRAFLALGSPTPPLFAIDAEGGEVYRTRGITSPLPSAAAVAGSLTPERAEALYRALGAQFAIIGLDLNLAPVAETLTDGNGSFLGTRAYSGDPAKVALYARAAVSGFQSGGVACAIKHFPGNGIGDPHRGLPRLEASKTEFERSYVAPFRKALEAKPQAVLVSHVIVAPVDPDRPFCLSPKGVTGLLRNDVGFKGLVITDDVAMSALSESGYSPSEAAVAALSAGCDMVMVSDPDIRSLARAIAVEAARDPKFGKRLDESVERILLVKARVGSLPTARERLAISMSRGSIGSSRYTESAIRARYRAAMDEAGIILEMMHGK